MTKVFIDLIDDIKSSELTEKGWNYIATMMLVLSGIYWIGLCDYGTFFQLTGCFLYCASAGIFATKSGWGKSFIKMLETEGE